MSAAQSEADTCVSAPVQPAHPRALGARAPSRSSRHDYQRQRKWTLRCLPGSRRRRTLKLDLFRSFLTLTARYEAARVFAVADNIVSTFEEYTRLYSDRDVEGVTNLCLWPFLAIRKGKAIHMP